MAIIGMRELLRDSGGIFERIENDGEPFVVTRRGRPIAALTPIGADDIERFVLASAPEFVSNRTEADNARAEGRTKPLEAVAAEHGLELGRDEFGHHAGAVVPPPLQAAGEASAFLEEMDRLVAHYDETSQTDDEADEPLSQQTEAADEAEPVDALGDDATRVIAFLDDTTHSAYKAALCATPISSAAAALGSYYRSSDVEASPTLEALRRVQLLNASMYEVLANAILDRLEGGSDSSSESGSRGVNAAPELVLTALAEARGHLNELNQEIVGLGVRLGQEPLSFYEASIVGGLDVVRHVTNVSSGTQRKSGGRYLVQRRAHTKRLLAELHAMLKDQREEGFSDKEREPRSAKAPAIKRAGSKRSQRTQKATRSTSRSRTRPRN